MALMKMVSSRMYEFLPSSLDNGQKSGQPLAMFISLTGLWNEEEVMSGRNASMMCSLLLWSSSISVTWKSAARFSSQTHSNAFTGTVVQAEKIFIHFSFYFPHLFSTAMITSQKIMILILLIYIIFYYILFDMYLLFI